MTDRSSITVVVVDDQSAMREAVVDLLGDAEGIDVIGEASNGEEAVAVAGAAMPDVVLMDMRMPVMDGVEATRQLMKLTPGVAVVAHTANGDEHLVLEALVAGARGYYLKGSSAAGLAQAITNVAAGQTHVADEVTRPVVDRLVGALKAERKTRLAAEESARRLEIVNQRQREFAVMSSHELRTPLTILLASLEALAGVPPGDEEERRFLEASAAEGGRRLLRLAENLEVAAGGADLEINIERVQISDICEAVLTDVAASPGAVELKIPNGVSALASARRLKQVLANLVLNAISASLSRAGVSIIAHAEAGEVIIDVCDHGSGFDIVPDFDREAEGHVEPFRLRPTASGGLGLGLWVAGELLFAMNGRIVARNDHDGGATVSIFLPRA